MKLHRQPGVVVVVLLTTAAACLGLSSGESTESGRSSVDPASPHDRHKSYHLQAIQRYILDYLNVSADRPFNRTATSLPPGVVASTRRLFQLPQRQGSVQQLRQTTDLNGKGQSSSSSASAAAGKSADGEGSKPRVEDAGGQRQRRRLDQHVDGTEVRKPGTRRRHSSRKRHHRKQIKLTMIPDTGVNSSGTDELQFTLQDVNEPNRRRRRRFEVTMASVNVLLGERTASHSRRSAAARPSGRRRRLGISVYAVKNPDEADVEDAPPSPLAVLQLTGSRSRRRLSSWERLRLPTTYIQDALDAGDGVVRLRIVCDGCDSFGRRLVVEPGPTAAPSSTADDEAPYLEVVGNRRRRRRHRHLLCPPSTSSVAEGSRLAAVIRRRCSLSSSRG